MSGRSSSRSNPLTNRFQADSHRLTHMNQQLQRINNRIEAKLMEYRHEAEANGQLMARATRLTERLELLRHKLRMCFDLSGEARPANLQIVLRQMADVDPDDAPPEFVCPITQCIMVDPVMTSDGNTYDRAAIAEWFISFQAKDQVPTSPLTNLLLPDTSLRPNAELRQKIMAFLRSKETSGKDGAKGDTDFDAEEPSLRIVPPSLLAVGVSSAAASSSSALAANEERAPIWSSAVVPLNEANSRELNLLRVSDFVVPPPSSSSALSSVASRPHVIPPPAARNMRSRLVSPGHTRLPPPHSRGVSGAPTGSARATQDGQDQLQMYVGGQSVGPLGSGNTNSGGGSSTEVVVAPQPRRDLYAMPPRSEPLVNIPVANRRTSSTSSFSRGGGNLNSRVTHPR